MKKNNLQEVGKNGGRHEKKAGAGLHNADDAPLTSGCCSSPGRRQFLMRLGLAGGAAFAVNAAGGALAMNAPGGVTHMNVPGSGDAVNTAGGKLAMDTAGSANRVKNLVRRPALDSNLFGRSTGKVMPAPLLPGDAGSKPVIRVGFSRAKDEYYMGWPGAAYDTKASQALYTQTLEKAASRLGVVLDIEHEPLRNNEYAGEFLQKTLSAGADGALLVVMNLNDGWPMVEHFVKGRGKLPVVIFSPLGTQFTTFLQPYRETPNCFLGSTEDIEWLDSALHLLKVVWQMDQTRIAAIWKTEERTEKLEPLGTTLVHMPLERFSDAYDATEGAEEAEAIARQYIENARDVVEPSRAEILEAARTYLANRRIMDESGCHAVTMDCLGLVTIKRTPPPCMAYMQLLNERTCGCCERDINAALSLMLSSYLFNKPAFLHNPTPNTVRNNYGGAHCTAPTLMDGFDGAGAQYILRNHHESDWGVAPQVLLRENQPATVMKFISPERLMAATGTILYNIDTRPDDGIGGCRTSFQMTMDDVADVRDIRGHHNVLVYGKYLNELRAWGQLAGVKVEHITG